MVTTANERDADASTVKFDSVVFCMKFMWQISLGVCYSIHDG